MRSPYRSLARVMMLIVIAASLLACASTQSGVPRADLDGNVPLVQIQNESYSEAVVFLDGSRLTEVRGSTSTVIPVSPGRIPANGQLHFTARLTSLNETVVLPVVQYFPGQKIRISIKPAVGHTAF